MIQTFHLTVKAGRTVQAALCSLTCQPVFKITIVLIMKIVRLMPYLFVILSMLSIGWVAILAINDPQEVMNLVHVQLPNNDALSSIRGVYGGVGLTIAAWLLYGCLKNVSYALAFLTCLWGAYALSRLLTILLDGPLNDFGVFWFGVESTFFLVALILFRIQNGGWELDSPKRRA